MRQRDHPKLKYKLNTEIMLICVQINDLYLYIMVMVAVVFLFSVVVESFCFVG